ncbi:flagellar biosynthetic protein FliO [Desulfospira joergensenii]|uniref:flagellar biosynthetic protein FliO n=1 Tax=Desulfospira joergensenii TaxID=53329 RepID=UPI0003B4B3E9|nr:flagellar biosynthetic protein FliO [Desulfospira joergensenii]
MNTDSEIWIAFFRTFSMLFLVLALLLLIFYLLRRFSARKGLKGSGQLIRVLATHHLSPKEKLVLVNVMEETILIGVTPSAISKISTMDKSVSISEDKMQEKGGFSGFLGRALGKAPGPVSGKENDLKEAGENET